MPHRYREAARLAYPEDSRSPGIVCLAFSPGAMYLASADTSGYVMIWRVEDFQRAFTVDTGVPTLSLAWAPQDAKRIVLFCGQQNGTILSVVLNPVRISVSHAYILRQLFPRK